MRRIISMMMIAAVALMATSCEKSSDTDADSDVFTLSGDKFIGVLTILGTEQEDITFYIDEDADNGVVDIMMPEVSFMPGLMPDLDMAFIEVPQTSTSPVTYSSDQIQMVGIYDRLPLINDVIQSITNISIVKSGYDIAITFDCEISTDTLGDMTVEVSYVGTQDGYASEEEEEKEEEEEEEEVVDPEFSLDNDEGFYITNSSGIVNLPDVTITYYQANNALVIDGFTYSTYLSTTTLPIVGVTAVEENGKTTLTADDLTVEYVFMTMDATGNVSGLVCEIIDGKAQLEFSITAAIGASGEESEYPCTYSGDITINDGSYE
ncbi:MAG: hypothetical protein R3Y04_08620 [Rikenellaceae bacterium]